MAKVTTGEAAPAATGVRVAPAGEAAQPSSGSTLPQRATPRPDEPLPTAPPAYIQLEPAPAADPAESASTSTAPTVPLPLPTQRLTGETVPTKPLEPMAMPW